MSDETYCRGVISITEFICNLNELVFNFAPENHLAMAVWHMLLVIFLGKVNWVR